MDKAFYVFVILLLSISCNTKSGKTNNSTLKYDPMNLNQTKTYGLTHLAIAVNDVERALKFYQEVFDMQVMYHEEDMIQLTTPGCNDIIVFEEKPEASIGNSGGIAHFGFRLRDAKDIEALHQKIIKAGGKVVDKGEFVPGSPYIFFKDLDNYTVEVWYELLQE